MKKDALAQSTLETAKMAFFEKFDLLPDDVKQGLLNGSLKVVNFVAYSAKNLAGATYKELMEASDNMLESITNVNNRKMEALQYFLVKGIRLQSAVIAGESAITETTIATAAFTTPSANVVNGEIEILISGKTALPRISCEVFTKSDAAGNGLKGYYELDCPFMIAPLSDIVPTLRLNSNATTTREVVRFEMYGCKIIPA